MIIVLTFEIVLIGDLCRDVLADDPLIECIWIMAYMPLALDIAALSLFYSTRNGYAMLCTWGRAIW